MEAVLLLGIADSHDFDFPHVRLPLVRQYTCEVHGPSPWMPVKWVNPHCHAVIQRTNCFLYASFQEALVLWWGKPISLGIDHACRVARMPMAESIPADVDSAHALADAVISQLGVGKAIRTANLLEVRTK